MPRNLVRLEYHAAIEQRRDELHLVVRRSVIAVDLERSTPGVFPLGVQVHDQVQAPVAAVDRVAVEVDVRVEALVVAILVRARTAPSTASGRSRRRRAGSRCRSCARPACRRPTAAGGRRARPARPSASSPRSGRCSRGRTRRSHRPPPPAGPSRAAAARRPRSTPRRVIAGRRSGLRPGRPRHHPVRLRASSIVAPNPFGREAGRRRGPGVRC